MFGNMSFSVFRSKWSIEKSHHPYDKHVNMENYFFNSWEINFFNDSITNPVIRVNSSFALTNGFMEVNFNYKLCFVLRSPNQHIHQMQNFL